MRVTKIENVIHKGLVVKHPDGYWKYGEKILNQLRKHPNHIGQLDGKTGREDTFQAIGDRSIRCALWMKQQGIKSGDIIALCTHNQLDATIPFLGALFIGAICNPWWETYLDEDLIRYFIELTKPRVIFASEESGAFIEKVVHKLQSKIKIIVLGKVFGMESLGDILITQSNENVEKFQCENIKTPDDPAVLIYTSGTTGKPKGVLLSYGSLTAGIRYSENDKVVSSRGFWCSSFCWISAVIGIMSCLIKVDTAIVYPNPTEIELCRLIEKYQINFLILGTAVANRLSHTKESLTCDMSSVELVFFSGAIISQDTEQYLLKIFPNATVFHVYGCTELAGGVSMSKVSKNSKACTCGKPCNNVEMKVIDPSSGKVLGPNEEGEICIKSPYTMNGYLKDLEATAQAIDPDGWYHSNDLGYYDEDGDFYVIDRLKELIKYKLYNIAPAPIEKCIQSHSSVAEVAVVAKPYSQDREHAIAFITKLPEKEVTEEEIMKLVESKLSDELRLYGGVKFLQQMPYTASGKISKKELRNLARQLAQ